MLSRKDCIAFSGLTEEQVLAIARHESVPDMAACALGEHLLCQPDGTIKIRDMIVENIRLSQHRVDQLSVKTQLHVLHHFLRMHPEARPETRPWSTAWKRFG